jgi:hypothetical protein
MNLGAELHAYKHLFWAALLAACLVWYSTVTVYVAIRGALDIKHMLARLAPPPEKRD